MVADGELKRYLKPCIRNLQSYCDEIIVHDESQDTAWLKAQKQVIHHSVEQSFYVHEGNARQALFDSTLAAIPTHVLCIDADEIVSDGPALRALLENNPRQPAWGLCMEEVWQATPEQLRIRMDGGWGSHHISCLFSLADMSRRQGAWRFPDRALACGRVPAAVNRMSSFPSDISIYHFGWANEAERKKRHARYEEHDKGNFHAKAHLDSIMWPDTMVSLCETSWPESLVTVKAAILRGAGYKTPKKESDVQVLQKVAPAKIARDQFVAADVAKRPRRSTKTNRPS